MCNEMENQIVNSILKYRNLLPHYKTNLIIFMKLFQGITKIVLSPLAGALEVIDDISGDNTETEQGLSIITLGVSSIVKGTAKTLKNGVEDIIK